MTKYTSNEQYERDKAALIRIAKGNVVPLIENADVFANLLEQSKWIGAVNQQDCGYHKPCTLLKDVDTTTIPN